MTGTIPEYMRGDVITLSNQLADSARYFLGYVWALRAKLLYELDVVELAGRDHERLELLGTLDAKITSMMAANDAVSEEFSSEWRGWLMRRPSKRVTPSALTDQRSEAAQWRSLFSQW